MPFTNEQAKQIKQQLLTQISQLPADQQQQAKEYIEAMNNEELEEFLKKQQAMAGQQQQGQAPQSKSPAEASTGKQAATECVFCALAKKQMPSVALYEDKDYIAALEIRPFSQGHTILIPKKHIKQTKSLPAKALTLANRIGKHIVKKLKKEKAESFQVTTTAEMNHAIVNIIPIYKDQPQTYQRQESKPEELQKLAIKIGEVPKRAPPKKKTKAEKEKQQQEKDSKESKGTKSNLPNFPRRVPR
jgi:diadenosine tetraphosphate (Ap4A) HIT family hydrolase